jgi:hypothetical protein
MNWSELREVIEKLYKEIIVKEQLTMEEMTNNGELEVTDRLTQEYLDFGYLYDDLKRILLPILENSHRNLQSYVEKKLTKVYFVALCEMIKHDYNRGMLITFKAVTGADHIDTNRYYAFLKKVTANEGIRLTKINNKNQYEEAFILESGIPKKFSKDVLKMFQIYWRYFRAADHEERRSFIYKFIKGESIEKVYILDNSNYNELTNLRERVKDFPEKVLYVFNKFEKIFMAMDDYDDIENLQERNMSEILNYLNNSLGFKVENVLRSSDLEKVYLAYISELTINKFEKILRNLDKQDIIINPRGERLLAFEQSSKNIWCGIYKIKGVEYKVILDPTLSLSEMLVYECNKIHSLADNYFFYSSEEYFDIEIDYKTINPRYLYYMNQSRYIWIGKVPPASKIYIDGKEIKSLQNYSTNYSVIKYFDRVTKNNVLKILVSRFKLNDKVYAYQKIQASLDNNMSLTLGYVDNRGMLYNENIYLDICKRQDEYTLRFLSDNDEINSSTFVLPDLLLFDKWNGTEYKSESPNTKNSGSLICFSKSDFSTGESTVVIEEKYMFLDYNVTVFKISTNIECIEICGIKWLFNKANRPYILLKQDNLLNQNVAYNPEHVVFKVINAEKISDCYMQVENGSLCYRHKLDQEHYFSEMNFLETVHGQNITFLHGKWFVSLWDNQRKVDEIDFIMVPKIRVTQLENIVLENTELKVKVSSDSPCFSDLTGGYTDSIEYSMGLANMEINDGFITSSELKSTIFNDKYSINQEIKIKPRVWGLRVKDYKMNVFLSDTNISLEQLSLPNKQCVVCSTWGFDALINGKNIKISPGYNIIKWYEHFSSYAPSNVIRVSDGRNSSKFFLGLRSKIVFYDKYMHDSNYTLKFSFTGPTNEKMIIRAYVSGNLVMERNLESIKNRYFIYYTIEGIQRFASENLIVEYISNYQKLPVRIYSEKIENLIPINKASERKLIEYIRVDKLVGDYYYQSKDVYDIKSKVLERINQIIGSR